VHRTCIAIYTRHMPRRGAAVCDLPHDLIHVEQLNGTRDLKCFITCLSLRDLLTRHAHTLSVNFVRKNQIVRQIRSRDIIFMKPVYRLLPYLEIFTKLVEVRALRLHRRAAISANFANYKFLSLCMLAHSADSDFNQLLILNLKLT